MRTRRFRKNRMKSGLQPSPKKKSRSLGNKVRQMMLIASPNCSYCDAPATTIDHIIPRSKGGTNKFENLTSACKKCNEQKADLDVEQFCKIFGRTLPVKRTRKEKQQLTQIMEASTKLRTSKFNRIRGKKDLNAVVISWEKTYSVDK